MKPSQSNFLFSFMFSIEFMNVIFVSLLILPRFHYQSVTFNDDECQFNASETRCKHGFPLLANDGYCKLRKGIFGINVRMQRFSFSTLYGRLVRRARLAENEHEPRIV